ncbi:MAG: hypothetical protein JXA69_02555 [Phycisphaerae bacterium]|nr:hypothetical protein [Phycisphaerae bacterium]
MQSQFAEHNAEQQRAWDAFHAGRPVRVPVRISANPRMILLDPARNADRITFEQYTADADIMLRVQLAFQYWFRHEVWFDHEMGLPTDGWDVYVDFQNVYEAAWLGSPVHFPADNCPYAGSLLDEDGKNRLFDRGIPDPFDDGGWMRRNWDFYAAWQERQRQGFEYQGRPIHSVSLAGLGTDGPFTLAVELRGEAACLDLILDPEYAHRLLTYLTEATIVRLRAYRERLGLPIRGRDFTFADDSIAMISADHFREFVLPCHRRLVETFWNGEGELMVHLCGDASRHFPVLAETLGVTAFDTGFPIDLQQVREQLGPDILLQGGPTVSRLRDGPIRQIEDETRSLLNGPVKNGRFILCEANNLAPGTPPEHVRAMYEMARKHGHY